MIIFRTKALNAYRFRINVFTFLMIILVAACKERADNPNADLQLSHYATLRQSNYALNSHQIRRYIAQLKRSDTDSMMPDMRCKAHYMRRGAFLWITRNGVNAQADTLLMALRNVKQLGFRSEKFRVQQITDDLRRARNLDFSDSSHTINKVFARLEYNLTKAYYRYAAGMQFGFVNPYTAFNRLDLLKPDSTSQSYRSLFDVPMKRLNRSFFSVCQRKLAHDSLAVFLQEILPQSALYKRYEEMLQIETNPQQRLRILCNMERARWRTDDSPSQHAKYVMVNIPAFQLRAVNGEDVLEMRVGCGALDTKTPLLTSRFMRMDINPQWIVPRSIIEKSILPQAGNAEYFEARNFFVRQRSTGRKMPLDRVTPSMLLSKDYLVIQSGGVGNSLGRIVFRFNNKFSVFLHDTDQRDFFAKNSRDVSHGCVRVQHPYALALFLLGEKDEQLAEKIRYSMTADIGKKKARPADGDEKAVERQDTLKRQLLIGSVNITPEVPLFITYFTLYPDANGIMRSYSDVYGYDQVMYNILKNYGAR